MTNLSAAIKAMKVEGHACKPIGIGCKICQVIRAARPVKKATGQLPIVGQRNLTDAQIQELADTLLGTCQTLNCGLAGIAGLREDFEQEDMSHADCAALDAIVLRCEGCDWWEESGLMADAYIVGEGRQLCEDCAETQNV